MTNKYDYKLNWPDFNATCDYSYNLSGIRVAFKARLTDDYLPGFNISVESLEQQIASQNEIHGPIELAYCTWSCECEDDHAIHVQGSIAAYIKIFHSEEFSAENDNKIKNDAELKNAILKLGQYSYKNLEEHRRLRVTSDADIIQHRLNNRPWYEAIDGALRGTWDYGVFTRLSDKLTLGVFFVMEGFWPTDKLPDPAHKDIVFESALDFLSHFKIVMPEDVTNHPDLPPLGLHLPNHEEKEVDPWFDTDNSNAPDTSSDEGW
jgi:hypothetical protein